MLVRIRSVWHRHGRKVLVIALIVMTVSAVGRLVYAIPYLFSDVAPWAAIDFKHRYSEVHRWFDGLPLYGVVDNADYPPASYVLFWPVLGWAPMESARWLFALTLATATGVLSYLSVRGSGAESTQKKWFAALLVFSIYPTQMIIFVGQVGIHVVAFLTAALIVMRRSEENLKHDALVAALFLPALLKPTLSVPFFWILLFAAGRIRPAAFVALGYGMLTVVAAAFQDAGFLELLRSWIDQAGGQAEVLEGHTNVHKWLHLAGLSEWMLPASIVILTATGGWIFRQRRADIWILIGVAALVARLFVHHRLHDDILILLPMIALLRISISRPIQNDVVAGLFVGAAWFTMLVPVWAFYDLGETVRVYLEVFQTIVWLSMLVYLMYRASHSRQGDLPSRIHVRGD